MALSHTPELVERGVGGGQWAASIPSESASVGELATGVAVGWLQRMAVGERRVELRCREDGTLEEPARPPEKLAEPAWHGAKRPIS